MIIALSSSPGLSATEPRQLAPVKTRLLGLLVPRTVEGRRYLAVEPKYQQELSRELGLWRTEKVLSQSDLEAAGYPVAAVDLLSAAIGTPDWREPGESLRRFVEYQRHLGKAVLLSGDPLPPADPNSYVLVHATYFYDVAFPAEAKTQPYVLFEPEAGWWHSSQSGTLSRTLLTRGAALAPFVVTVLVLGGAAAIWVAWQENKRRRKSKR